MEYPSLLLWFLLLFLLKSWKPYYLSLIYFYLNSLAAPPAKGDKHIKLQHRLLLLDYQMLEPKIPKCHTSKATLPL